METFKELKYCISKKIPLFWSDPDYIKGNDYLISFIENINDDFDEYTPILIQYGGGSEAQVFLHEIKILNN